MKQDVIFTNDVEEAISRAVYAIGCDRCYVLCDEHTHRLVLPRIDSPHVSQAHTIVIEAGEEAKSIRTVERVWQELCDNGATRRSLLINIGGGMVTDLGGFAAATFKRGVSFVNIPTTLLGAVDAAVGGKTGVNFAGLKNEIGAFAPASSVVISSRFFDTLPREELLSGFAEMIKHGLIDGSSHFNSLLNVDVASCCGKDMLGLLQQSIEVKQRIVAQDPYEKGMRKWLNLGHTVGHAIESHSHRHGRAVPHGYAVAWGLVCELILSHRLLKFPSEVVYALAKYVDNHYGAYAITCDDYDELIELMQHDKKNESDKINFTLLHRIGDCAINNAVERKEIEISLDFYRDLFHL